MEHGHPLLPGEKPQMVKCRMRSLGCSAVHGRDPLGSGYRAENYREMLSWSRRSERENRVIDHDQEGSMEIKKREGYF